MATTTTNLGYFALTDAIKLIPPNRSGRPIHIATIMRWITTGTVGPSGEVVRLQAVRLGGRWLTTREWIDDYARRLTPTYGRPNPTNPTVTKAPTRAAQRAADALAAAGI